MNIFFKTSSTTPTPVHGDHKPSKSSDSVTHKSRKINFVKGKNKARDVLVKLDKKAGTFVMKPVMALTKLFSKKTAPARDSQVSHLPTPAEMISLSSGLREYTCAGMIGRMNNAVDAFVKKHGANIHFMGSIPYKNVDSAAQQFKLKYENLLREKIDAAGNGNGSDGAKPVTGNEYSNAHADAIRDIRSTSNDAVAHVAKIAERRVSQDEYNQYLRDSSAPGYDAYFDVFVVQLFNQGPGYEQPFLSVPQPSTDAGNYLRDNAISKTDTGVGTSVGAGANTVIGNDIEIETNTVIDVAETPALPAQGSHTDTVTPAKTFASAESLRNRWDNLLNDPELSRLLSRGKTPGAGA
jgi:hypothetical protein